MSTLFNLPIYQLVKGGIVNAAVIGKRCGKGNEGSAKHDFFLKTLVLSVITIGALCFFASGVYAQTDKGTQLIQQLREPSRIAILARTDEFKDPNAAKVLSWLYLSQYPDYASFDMLRAFLSVNDNWPREDMLFKKLEQKFPKTARPYDVKNWFDAHPPVSADGAILYINALKQLGYNSEIKKKLREFWYKANISNREIDLIIEKFSPYFSEQDHINRANNLIWDGRTSSARKLLPLISEDRRLALEARIMLADQQNGVDDAVARVPENRHYDAGLVYERVRWRRRAGFNDSALELLNDPKVDQSQHPDKWWSERHILIRRAIEDKNWKKALSIARQHRQNTGFSHTQAQFLLGWLTLKASKDADHAAVLFERMYDSVETPMSLTRAAYWAGRAYEKDGNKVKSKEWYKKAAEHPMFFYGQLANTKLGRKDLDIKWQKLDTELANSSNLVYHPFASAIRVLTNAGLPEYNDIFFAKLLAQAESKADFSYVAELAREAHRFDFAIRAAKEMYNKHNIMLSIGYPNLPHLSPDITTQSHLLGLIRQESIFYPRAGSHVGAKGLMQLMPATAKEQSQMLGIPYSYSDLLDDPKYNTTLGTAYIERMLKYYDGNYVLATAAYNAGFGRINGWIKKFGDPRSDSIDMVDWIESLPVYETRNYIQRVLEATRVYHSILDEPEESLLSSNYKL